MNHFKKKIWIIASLLVALTLLAACGNNKDSAENGQFEAQTPSEQNSGTEAKPDAEATTERTLTDAMGHEVKIPAEPKRVIASYLEDNLVALGITPAAQWSVNGGSVQDYLQEYLKDVPTIEHDLPFEAVASFQPDLLIMDSASMVEGNKYSQYDKIAPTYVVGTEVNNDWREELMQVGEIFDMKEEAQAALDKYEQKAKDAKEQIQQGIGGESAAAIWLVGGKLFVVSETLSSGAVMYGDLGLAVPNVVKEISASATGNWSSISLEKLAELDADHLFFINSDGEGAEVLQDPLWANIPAVKNGNIYEYGKETSWLYTGTIANTQIIDDVLESLVK
ncbi:ABC transporter substrate-binding protein [Paenibacillus glucanolyticus]|uniref:ABC transporter substrate-binding protein n=1 Tax=Paenibacillus TaxID=44249 RepID=UPI0003E28C6D|nr:MULTISPECIES: ABC transporter substrate-binding protein [Paenibacillus]ANA78982.1 ABC transporter substrate-binding protein [Paenibacillus glucanolyticus]AVV57100.1 ABC transporter substrate-binding protein [Paenibacillus glucanolyticus]AWP26242.1 ABC transporter substrate-binding protein [Paenibacillus sp. Cedars]ETT32213.1 periplasmic-binding protein [Paenibacillus sp. FSL R5-808]MPY16580.1 ABC transporter substrate-binding protein [Paenibacillus glucanolyticus]